MLNIVIPVYNSRDTLPLALDSLVAQTKKMFIVTLSIDGDNEDYSDIVEEYERRGLHIRVIKGPNGGPGPARQRGVDCDKMCDYVMFMDADDCLMPNAVDTLYTEAKRNGVDVLSSDFICEQKYASNRTMNVFEIPVTWCHGKIYSVKYLRDNNIRFRDDLRYNEDSYFNLVVVNCARHQDKLQEVTYLWRHNEKSITRQGSYMDFFKLYWEMYIYSQVKGIEKIVELKGKISPTLLAATFINMYKWVMTAISCKYDVTKAENYIKELREVPEVVESLDNWDFWVYVHENLKASYYIEEKLIFFSERFSDWIKRLVKTENN